MKRVRKERTGWRDEKLSQRHREWGDDCPMVDIDFLVVEYYYSKPKAIVEYKSEHADINFNKLTEIGMAPQSYKAIEYLANAANIPFFVVRYKTDFSSWNITPMNKHTQKYVNINETKNLSEETYVELLYKIRGRSLPEDIKQNLRRLSSSTKKMSKLQGAKEEAENAARQ